MHLSPSKIICVGLNYRDHAEETKGEIPAQPLFFSKFSDTLVPNKSNVILPRTQRCFDYEGELVIVLGADGMNIPEEDADSYIYGYAAGNDLSARDCQFISGQWLIGKSFPGFAPVNFDVVPAADWSPYEKKHIRTYVNGELKQNGSTSDMIFSPREIVSAASKYFALKAGDIIFTGTPAGVQLGQPKGDRVWLKAGDTVTIDIEGLPELVTYLK
jgi:2-keto-4-pentenoate hydratase/2-oxohepta-3-ene-1,7-dioic acid hydratase in catechol pathway